MGKGEILTKLHNRIYPKITFVFSVVVFSQEPYYNLGESFRRVAKKWIRCSHKTLKGQNAFFCVSKTATCSNVIIPTLFFVAIFIFLVGFESSCIFGPSPMTKVPFQMAKVIMKIRAIRLLPTPLQANVKSNTLRKLL
mgnify:CR=1 FL=1